MRQAREDRDERAGGATMLQPLMLRLTRKAAAFAAARPVGCFVYYCRTYMKAVRGGGVKRGDVCYGMLRAAACVDESDHHALMYVWHGQIVREDRVGEASARRP